MRQNSSWRHNRFPFGYFIFNLQKSIFASKSKWYSLPHSVSVAPRETCLIHLIILDFRFLLLKKANG